MALDWQQLIGLRGPAGKGEPGSTGLGPDFPESAGDREKGKFRPSNYPRLTRVAISNDDGTDVGEASFWLEESLLLELRAIRLGIQLLINEISSTSPDVSLIDMASDTEET